MQKISEWFESRSLAFWTISSITQVGMLGVVDYASGNEISFSLFYLLPVSLVVWYVDSTLGLIISFISAVVWLAADISVGENYSHPIIYFWNTLIRFAFFLVVTYLLSKLRETQKEVQTLARTDFMTGAFNSRYFHELLGRELGRSNRYKRPFTLVYLDLDNFKQVNDTFGHVEGDRLISFIANELKRQVRTTDIVSRLGGDEFAILFPEAGQQDAQIIIGKLCDHIARQLSGQYSFVTFSAGAVTYLAAPESIAETIKIADDLMYSVKSGTKNGIRYSLYNG